MIDLTSRSVLVTGGSRGIGRSIALKLAELGASVAITYSRSADAAQEVVKEIEAGGGKALALQADAADLERASAVITEINQRVGRTGCAGKQCRNNERSAHSPNDRGAVG